MTSDQQQQDHPGPEWVEVPQQRVDHSHGTQGLFTHPGLKRDVYFGDAGFSRPQAVTYCRAISAAALAWERQVADARGLGYDIRSIREAIEQRQ